MRSTDLSRPGPGGRHGIEVLPVVMWTPTWASSRPDASNPQWHAPEPLSLYGDFLREAIRRYGPRGSFSAEHPELSAQPIRAWRRFFDAAAVHVFTLSVKNTIRVLRAHRRVMRRAGDTRKPVYVTELSFLGARGRIPRRAELGLEVTPAQQRRMLRGAHRNLARRRALRVRRAYWFNWSSSYSARECETGALGFQFVGLVSYRCGGSIHEPTGLLSSYSRAARELQGCAKSTDARRCR